MVIKRLAERADDVSFLLHCVELGLHRSFIGKSSAEKLGDEVRNGLLALALVARIQFVPGILCGLCEEDTVERFVLEREGKLRACILVLSNPVVVGLGVFILFWDWRFNFFSRDDVLQSSYVEDHHDAKLPRLEVLPIVVETRNIVEAAGEFRFGVGCGHGVELTSECSVE